MIVNNFLPGFTTPAYAMALINKTFTRKLDAENWAKAVELEMDRGEWHDKTAAEGKTLADVLTEYRDGHAATLKDKGVPARVDAIIKRWPKCKKVSMLRLDQAMITEYIDMRLDDEADDDEGVSGDTVNRELNIISAAINRAISAGLPVSNPVEKIKRPKGGAARDRRLQDGELDALLHELRPRERAKDGTWAGGVASIYPRWIVELAVETAMRRGEILGLDWRHVHLSKSYVHLPATKNGDRRDVPLSSRARTILRDLQKDRDPEESRVFPITKDALKKCWTRAVERANSEDLRFHDLRHEATSRLAEKLDMLELSAVTGHKDPRMLKRYYHPRAQNLAKKLG